MLRRRLSLGGGTKPLLFRYIPSIQGKSVLGRDAAALAVDNINTTPQQHLQFLQRNPNHVVNQGRSTAMRSRLTDAKVVEPTTYTLLNTNKTQTLHYVRINPSESGLCHSVCYDLARMGITELTPLQGALVPLFLKGQHVVAHAETGSGKSFGIAVAAVNRIIREDIPFRLHTCILVPTEELALQYDRWLKFFGGCSGVVCQLAIPSIALDVQLARLHNIQPHILVGTPQRVAEINSHSENILGEKLRRKVDTIVVDEADAVLAMNINGVFSKNTAVKKDGWTTWDLIDRIYRRQRDEPPAQLICCSATVDGRVAKQLATWTTNDNVARIVSNFTDHAIPPSLEFYFTSISMMTSMESVLGKVVRLIMLQCKQPRVLIFTKHDTEVEQITGMLKKLFPGSPMATVPTLACAEDSEVEAEELASIKASNSQLTQDIETFRRSDWIVRLDDKETNSDRSASVRPKELQGRDQGVFINNSSSISRLTRNQALVGIATHAVARGLHVADVTHVLMVGEAPESATDYLHCIGRTGRMGKKGVAVSLFTPSSGRQYQQIAQVLDIEWRMTREGMFDNAIEQELKNRSMGFETRFSAGEDDTDSTLHRSVTRQDIDSAEDDAMNAIRDPYVHGKMQPEGSGQYQEPPTWSDARHV